MTTNDRELKESPLEGQVRIFGMAYDKMAYQMISSTCYWTWQDSSAIGGEAMRNAKGLKCSISVAHRKVKILKIGRIKKFVIRAPE